MKNDVAVSSNFYGFLFVFNKLYPLLRILWVINIFSIVRNSGVSVSAVKVRPRPEMPTPFDSLTPNFYLCSVGIFRRVSITVQKLFHVFPFG